MKESTIETKAYDDNYKTYAELINRLEDAKNAIKKQNYGIAMDILCKPYPRFEVTTQSELAESEDERIRKVITDIVKAQPSDSLFNSTKEKCLAWIEKQGEQKPTEWHREDEQNLNACLGYIPDEFLRRWLKDAIHVKYDKPKFKVGDKIQYLKDCGIIMTIEKIENGEYIFGNNMGHITIESGNEWHLVDAIISKT